MTFDGSRSWCRLAKHAFERCQTCMLNILTYTRTEWSLKRKNNFFLDDRSINGRYQKALDRSHCVRLRWESAGVIWGKPMQPTRHVPSGNTWPTPHFCRSHPTGSVFRSLTCLPTPLRFFKQPLRLIGRATSKLSEQNSPATLPSTLLHRWAVRGADR